MMLATALLSGCLLVIILAAVSIATVGIDELLREHPEEEW